MAETIGEQLRKARLERKLSLDEVARATHIRAHYLAALEKNDFASLPSPAQARGFLRAYAGFLKLDAEEMLKTQEFAPAPVININPPTGPRPAKPLPEPDTDQADAIFYEIGLKLRQQREVLSLSLEDVERHTHLRAHYLQVLESGNWKGLPSPVQGRGMLNNYASFLGMEPEPLLLRFAEGLQAILAAKQAVSPTRRKPPTRPVNKEKGDTSETGGTKVPIRLFSLDTAIVSLVVIFLAGFVIWGGLRIVQIRSGNSAEGPTQTPPSIADVLISEASITPEITEPAAVLTVTATATLPLPEGGIITPTVISAGSELLTPEAGTMTGTVNGTVTAPATSSILPTAQALIPTSNGSGAVQIYIVVQQRAWLRVMVDGEVALEQRVLAGSAYQFAGDERVEILTGNGAALQVFYNQVDQGILGDFGQVVNVIYTLEGPATPTPTIEPTGLQATQTPPPGPLELTPGPTQPPGKTATPTRTPTPSPTPRSTQTKAP